MDLLRTRRKTAYNRPLYWILNSSSRVIVLQGYTVKIQTLNCSPENYYFFGSVNKISYYLPDNFK